VIVLAHVGHYWGAIAAALPVVAVAAWIGIAQLRDRRRRRGGR
jgi:hypothetical protein